MKIRTPPTLLFGAGVVAEIASIVGELGVTRPLLVTDPGVAATGLPERIRQDLLAAGCAPALWDGVATDPDEEHVERCRERIEAGSHDAVVAVGGGSVIDVAKVAAVLPANGGRTAHYFGFDRVRQPGLTVVAVPTTAGSGSEVSSHAVIQQRQPRRKEVVGGIHLLPRAAVVDPALTATLPAEQTACTALDGLTHAIEAFLARRATHFTDRYARTAIPRIARSLPRLLAHPRDEAAREELSLGCLDAGLAMANAGAGAIHALGYPLTSSYGIPHGLANALVAAATLERSWPGNPERHAELARLLGATQEGVGAGELSRCMRLLLALAGLHQTLCQRGVSEDDLPQLAEEASRFRPVIENSPVAFTSADLLAIYRRAWRPDSSPSESQIPEKEKGAREMKFSSPKAIFASALVVVFLLALTALDLQAADPKPSVQPAQPAKSASAATLQKADAKRVCMIHNEAFTKDMIPVVVAGRTYYAFCNVCKGKLSQEAERRTAIDPFSGKKVDKAKAVIGVKSDGKVLYFESAQNLEKYKAKMAG